MRGFGFDKAAVAGLICFFAVLALPPVALAQSEAGAAAPAAAAQPVVLNRVSDAPRASTTRYSKRQKNAISAGSVAPAMPATVSRATAAGAADTVCHAGCKQPGEVVFAPPAAAAVTQPAVQTTDITCVAGCYNGETVIAAAASAQSSYLTTGSRLPKTSAPTSGEWMVKINRERGR